MAYVFVAASTQYLNTSTSPVSALPFTAFASFYPTRNTVRENILSPNVNSSTDNTLALLEYDATVAGTPVRATYRVALSAVENASSTVAPTLNAWNAAMAVFTSSSSRSIYLNGGNSATNSNTATGTPTFDRVSIAALLRATAALYFDGRVAETAFWSVALNTDEMASLAKGFKPHRIRPQSLVFYAPLIRNLQDVKAGRTITNNNTATVGNHPRVY